MFECLALCSVYYVARCYMQEKLSKSLLYIVDTISNERDAPK